MGNQWLPIMKNKRLSVRVSDRRLHKLHLYAASREKTIASLVEDWIDSLPQEEIDKNGAILHTLSPKIDFT